MDLVKVKINLGKLFSQQKMRNIRGTKNFTLTVTF